MHFFFIFDYSFWNQYVNVRLMPFFSAASCTFFVSREETNPQYRILIFYPVAPRSFPVHRSYIVRASFVHRSYQPRLFCTFTRYFPLHGLCFCRPGNRTFILPQKTADIPLHAAPSFPTFHITPYILCLPLSQSNRKIMRFNKGETRKKKGQKHGILPQDNYVPNCTKMKKNEFIS